jgi:hypothetical protein
MFVETQVTNLYHLRYNIAGCVGLQANLFLPEPNGPIPR